VNAAVIDDFIFGARLPKNVWFVFWRGALAGGRLEQVLGKVTLTFANERIFRITAEKLRL
jgi:hypothetical protein